MGGKKFDKIHYIDTETFESFQEARRNLEQVSPLCCNCLDLINNLIF